MYLYENEIPEIKVTIFYYDTDYKRATVERVLEILERNRLFLPERLCAGHLTRGRMKKYTPDMRELFLQAYSEPDVLGVEWEAGREKRGEEHLFFRWNLTFYKESDHSESSYHPWNVLSFSATYEWMRVPGRQAQLLQCVRELCEALNAFRADMDDIANGVDLRERAGEETRKADYIQQIYWGNYLGQHLKEQISLRQLRAMRLPNYAETEKGVFFTLTEDVFDFESPACEEIRKKVFDAAGGEAARAVRKKMMQQKRGW